MVKVRVVLAGVVLGLTALVVGVVPGCGEADDEVTLLNLSYDPTRELWRDLNAAFVPSYRQEHGVTVTVRQSHGGSSSQARAVLDGLRAHVVTLALWNDIDAIAAQGLMAPDWERRLPHRSLPWVSTIVFVVRKGNPKGIRDWPDLVQGDVKVITPNPMTSGNGRLSFLAAWGSVRARGGSESEAEAFVRAVYRRVPVLDSGARGSTVTFAQRRLGDVHLTWENEAHLEVAEAKGALEIVYPPISLRAEPPVAVVDANVRDPRRRAAAEAYLRFLYTDAAQEIIARHGYRPINDAIRKKHADRLPDIELFPVTAVAKDWRDTQRFFADGGAFDRIYEPTR